MVPIFQIISVNFIVWTLLCIVVDLTKFCPPPSFFWQNPTGLCFTEVPSVISIQSAEIRWLWVGTISVYFGITYVGLNTKYFLSLPWAPVPTLIKLETSFIRGFLQLPLWCNLGSNLCKHAGGHSVTTEAHTSRAQVCVVWRSGSSLEPSLLCIRPNGNGLVYSHIHAPLDLVMLVVYLTRNTTTLTWLLCLGSDTPPAVPGVSYGWLFRFWLVVSESLLIVSIPAACLFRF